MDYSKFTVMELKHKLASENLPTSGNKSTLIERLKQTKDLGPVIQPSTSFSENIRVTRSKSKAAQSDDIADTPPNHAHKVKPLRIVLDRIDISKYQTKSLNGSVDAKALNKGTDNLHAKTTNRNHDKVNQIAHRVTRSQAKKRTAATVQDLGNVSNDERVKRRRIQQTTSDKVPSIEQNSQRVTRSQAQQQIVVVPKDAGNVSNDKGVKRHRTQQTTKAGVASIDQNASVIRLQAQQQTVADLGNASKSNAAKRQPKKRQNKRLITSIISLMPTYRNFEMIWALVRGYPNWPGIIESETPKGRYIIHFFGDYSRFEVHKNKITHFMEGFNKLDRPSVKLTKAIIEARLFVIDQNRSSCPICDMLELKRQFNENNQQQ